MMDDDSDGESQEDSGQSSSHRNKRKVKRSSANYVKVTCYTRAHLHRSCKLVIQDSGKCLFAIQRELNVRHRHKTNTLPKLPPEIWIKIFSYITAERQYPFMIRAPLVCKLWYNLCLSPCLWTIVRVPYGGYYWMRRTDLFLTWLAKNRLRPCKEIDLTGWDISSKGIKELTENCPRLQAINLSYCTKLSKDVATYFTKNCPHLTTLDFSHTCNDLVSVIPMTVIIEHYNAQLLSLNLSGNLMHGFHRVLDAICENCPNLETLSINYCRVDILTLDIERFQRNLPHLRSLNMGYILSSSINIEERPSELAVIKCVAPRVIESHVGQLEDEKKQYLSPGFQSLEDLSIAVGSPCDNRHPLPVNNNFIERMVMSSRQLKRLDIRGAEHFSVRTLLKLPCPDLEKLMLGIRVIDDPRGLVEILKMWRHSLTEIILSYSSFSLTDVTQGMFCLVEKENTVIERIELENLGVEMPLVKAICANCPNLRTINLQKCLSLPKKLRRFFDRQKIPTFRNIVSLVCKHMNSL